SAQAKDRLVLFMAVVAYGVAILVAAFPQDVLAAAGYRLLDQRIVGEAGVDQVVGGRRRQDDRARAAGRPDDRVRTSGQRIVGDQAQGADDRAVVELRGGLVDGR